MTDIQAAVGIKQLEKLDKIVEERRKVAFHYHEAFKDIDVVRLPEEEEGYFSNYQSYSIYLKPECKINRNDLMQSLLDKGISTRRGITTAHRETAYKNYQPFYSLPVSEDASDRSIVIPLYYPMPQEEIDYVIENFRNLVQ